MSRDEELPALPDDILALLDAEKSFLPPAALKAKVLSGVLLRIGAPGGDGGDGGGDTGGDLGGGGGGGAAAAGAGMAKASALATATKVWIGSAFVAGALAGGTAVTTLAPEAKPEIVYVDRPAPPLPPPPPEREVEEVELERPRPRERPKKDDHDERGSREQALVERARTALGRGEAKDAYAALLDHQKQFMNGRLVEEREALLTLALLALDRRADAEAQAARFRARYPKSLHLPAIDARLKR